jgi:hypothetical protein
MLSFGCGQVIWNLSVVFWGARLVCQLRKRPNLVDLQVKATSSLHVLQCTSTRMLQRTQA